MAAILLNGAEQFEKKCQYPFETKPRVSSGESCSSGFREEDILKYVGCCGGHLGFLFGTILVIFDL